MRMVWATTSSVLMGTSASSRVVGFVLVALLVVGVGAQLVRRAWRRHRDRAIPPTIARAVGPVTPPESPYASARGVRLLRGDPEAPVTSSEPPRPRLDPDREYVFGDAAPSSDEVVPATTHRGHDERWALERSLHHRRRRWRRAALLVGVALVVVIVVVYLVVGHHGATPPGHALAVVGSWGLRG
ncbi:MAG: hypothetical protein ACP5PB_08500 [Acidimicrobiales bacterium]